MWEQIATNELSNFGKIIKPLFCVINKRQYLHEQLLYKLYISRVKFLAQNKHSVNSIYYGLSLHRSIYVKVGADWIWFSISAYVWQGLF